MLSWLLFFLALISKPAQPSVVSTSTIVAPVADFRARITKKSFGTYVTPKKSPISPEKFTGYHTGVDVEYGDITTDVPVIAIAAGEIITSRFASGYGGVVVIKHFINGQTYYGIYGHLRPASLLPVGTAVTLGQTIGVLGKAYSSETDGERRHLHFGLVRTHTLLGYVPKRSQLSGWVDPLTVIPQ